MAQAVQSEGRGDEISFLIEGEDFLYYASFLQQCPTIKQLALIVVPTVAPDWYLLGISLEVPVAAMKTIEREHKEDLKRTCVEMFTKWLHGGGHQQGGKCSWKQVLEAVAETCGRGVSNDIKGKVLLLVQEEQSKAPAPSVRSLRQLFDVAAEENRPAVKPAKFTGIRKGPQAIQSEQDDIKMEVMKAKQERKSMQERLDKLEAEKRQEKLEAEKRLERLEAEKRLEKLEAEKRLDKLEAEKCLDKSAAEKRLDKLEAKATAKGGNAHVVERGKNLGYNRDGTTPGPVSMGTPAAATVQPPSQVVCPEEQQHELTSPFATTKDVVEIPLEKTHRKMIVKKAQFIYEDADIKVAAICSELGFQTGHNKELDGHLKGQLSEAVQGRYQHRKPDKFDVFTVHVQHVHHAAIGCRFLVIVNILDRSLGTHQDGHKYLQQILHAVCQEADTLEMPSVAIALSTFSIGGFQLESILPAFIRIIHHFKFTNDDFLTDVRFITLDQNSFNSFVAGAEQHSGKSLRKS